MRTRNIKKLPTQAHKERHYQTVYNVTLDQRDELLAAQGGKCAICCRRIIFRGTRGAHLDHCHETGRIRGVLCGLCNTGLGKLGDNEEGLLRALEYVRRNSPLPGVIAPGVRRSPVFDVAG